MARRERRASLSAFKQEAAGGHIDTFLRPD